MSAQTVTRRVSDCKAASSRREHGTRARYVSGCRCLKCRAANSNYSVAREHARLQGDTRDLVPAYRARKHILQLADRGVGYKQVALAAGLGKTLLLGIRSGRKLRIRAHNERAILAVDEGAIADGSLIPAKPTWKKLDELIERGFSKRQIADWLGFKSRSIHFRKDFITARSAMRVDRMMRLLKAGKLMRTDGAK